MRQLLCAFLLVLSSLWAAPAGALAPGDILLVDESTLFHYETATGTLRVLSSPDVGAGPVFSGGSDVAVLRFGQIAVAADAIYLVDPATGDRTQLSAPLGAYAVDSIRDGGIFALGTNSYLYEVDPITGQAVQRASYFLDFPTALHATPDQKLLLPIWEALLEYDPATGQTRTVSALSGSSKGPRGTGPSLGELRGVAAPPGNAAYAVINGGMSRVLLDSGNRELVAGVFGGPGSGPIWWGDVDGVELDPQRRPLVVGRRANDVLAWYTLDPVTLVRTVVEFPTASLGGVPFADSDGFAVVPADDDADGTGDDVLDLCPSVFNPGQEDADGNLVGDACNTAEDADGDDFANALDNCPATANGQTDTDGDGVGDACNDADDSDGDEWRDDLDNCPFFPNDQLDSDGDGEGDPCDAFPAEPDNEKGQLRVDLALAEEELAQCLDRRPFVDSDGDGEEDSGDACPGTETGVAVDTAGCSLAQFCGQVGGDSLLRLIWNCRNSDWQNDEPRRWLPHDCQLVRENLLGLRCVPESPAR